MKNRIWTLEHYPADVPTAKDLVFQETDVKPVDDNEVRIRVVYISMDPANRLWIRPEGSYMPPIPLGSVMPGICLGVVEESKHPRYKQGDVVQGVWGWQEYVVLHGGPADRQLTLNEGGILLMPSPPPGSDWIDYFGLFGVHGSTAWFGIVDEGLVQAGQTVLISAAAGAIGSLCVQIAKARGARVIGLAGSAEKCRKVESLGADVCINYKADDVSERLKAIAPDGIHMYFDNVGGETLEAAIDNMAHYGRIVFCGAISQYNDDQMGGPGNFQQILYKELTLKGYLVATYMGRMEESIGALAQMKASGQIRMDLDVRHGIENALGALNSLFDGSNTGKVVLQVSSFEA